MEELSHVHRYAAGALFSLALNQAQIHRLGPVPELQQSDEDGPKYPVLSADEGNVPWGSESCGLLRHVLRYLNIDPQAWPGIEITAALPDSKHHIGPSRGGTFGFSPDLSGSKDIPTEQELLASLSRLGLSPRLSGWTKKILSTFSTFGLPLQSSAPATIELGVQSTLKTFELPQFAFSTAEIHSLLSTLGLSPRPILSTSRYIVFNPSLPTQRKRQLTRTTHGLSPSSSFSTAYPTGEDVQSIISAIGLSRKHRLLLYPNIEFQECALIVEKEKFIRILQEDSVDTRLPSSTSPSTEFRDSTAKPEKSIATLSKAIDAMALSLEEFAEARPSAKEKTFEETFADHIASTESEQPSTSGPDSVEREASLKEPLLGQQISNSQAPSWSAEGGASTKEPLLGQQGSDSLSPTGPVEKTEADVLTEDEGKESTKHRTLVKQRKVAVLYEVLTACVADTADEKAGKSVLRAGYDARQRAAIRLLALWLDIEWKTVAAIELMVAYMAMAAEREREAEKNPHSGEKEKQGWAKWKRGGIIGAAALTGGVLLAVTGGLAAPAIAAGLGALAPVLGIGGLATVVGSAAGSVAVAASFGAAGAGLAGTKMARRTGGVDEFMFLPIGNNHQQGRLAVGIMISGIVFEGEDFTRPWEGPDWDLERYALLWETKELMAVSTAIEDWLASNAAQQLFKAGAMMTVLAGLVAALAWPATLLAATDWIDSKWSIAIDRSDKAGIVLAKCLLKGTQGNRPVTLIGFSLGARVIFSCLEYLAKKGDSGSIVERVVLLGAPITLDKQKWKTVRKVVAGRFINAYSTNDWILGVIYRASFVTHGLAGLSRVEIPGIENVDVTEVVNGHSMYLSKTSEVLAALDIDNFYPVYPSKVHAAAPLALEAPTKPNQVPESSGLVAPLALKAASEPNQVPETSDHATPVAEESPSEPH